MPPASSQRRRIPTRDALSRCVHPGSPRCSPGRRLVSGPRCPRRTSARRNRPRGSRRTGGADAQEVHASGCPSCPRSPGLEFRHEFPASPLGRCRARRDTTNDGKGCHPSWGRPLSRNHFCSKDLPTRVRLRERSSHHGGASCIPTAAPGRELDDDVPAPRPCLPDCQQWPH